MIQTVPPLATVPSRSAVEDGDRRMFSGVPPVLAMPVPAIFPVAAAAAGAVVARLLPSRLAASRAARVTRRRAVTVSLPGTRSRAHTGQIPQRRLPREVPDWGRKVATEFA